MIEYVALLRGINVGAGRSVPMVALAAEFAAAEASDVRTYIQSGNVMFRTATDPAELGPALERRISERFGFAIPVVLRTREELEAVRANNPFEGEDPARLLVFFLGGVPTAEAVASLDPARSPPDRFRVIGQEIYAHCPHGIGVSKLTNDWFERRLRTPATGRNWKTLEALLGRMA